MPDQPLQRTFVRFTEALLEEHGPESQSAVGWFRGDAEARYRVMLDVIRPADQPVTLLDFGCGLAGLYDYIQREGIAGVEYSGLDISERFLALARQKHPETTFYQIDVLDPLAPALPNFDYIVLNGIFTYKADHSHDEMFGYLRTLVPRLFELARVGIAFNVITAQVDWPRDDLFHLPVDPLLHFLSREVSRHVVIRHDYGLYEYTAFVYREPSDPDQAGARRLLRGVQPESPSPTKIRG